MFVSIPEDEAYLIYYRGNVAALTTSYIAMVFKAAAAAAVTAPLSA